MSKVEAYRRQLRMETDWRRYLVDHSGLPGERLNTALALAVAEEGDRVLFGTLTSAAARSIPDSPEEFLIVCGVVGLGRLIAEGDDALLPALSTFADSPSPRLQQAVVLALRRIAEDRPEMVLAVGEAWIEGSAAELRAVATWLVDHGLPADSIYSARALDLLERATAAAGPDRIASPEALAAVTDMLATAWTAQLEADAGRARERLRNWPDHDLPRHAWMRAIANNGTVQSFDDAEAHEPAR